MLRRSSNCHWISREYVASGTPCGRMSPKGAGKPNLNAWGRDTTRNTARELLNECQHTIPHIEARVGGLRRCSPQTREDQWSCQNRGWISVHLSISIDLIYGNWDGISRTSMRVAGSHRAASRNQAQFNARLAWILHQKSSWTLGPTAYRQGQSDPRSSKSVHKVIQSSSSSYVVANGNRVGIAMEPIRDMVNAQVPVIVPKRVSHVRLSTCRPASRLLGMDHGIPSLVILLTTHSLPSGLPTVPAPIQRPHVPQSPIQRVPLVRLSDQIRLCVAA